MNYKQRLAKWTRGRFVPPPEPPLQPMAPTITEMVAMRDGVRLYTEVFLPNQAAESLAGKGNREMQTVFPVIFTRSPYPYSCFSRNAGSEAFQRYLAAGYAVVFQLTRGQGQSEGRFRMYRDDSLDGYDAIEWIAEQPWCNGNVGMQGASYLGSTQLMAARAKPPALKCIMPTAFVGSFTRYFPFAHGVPHRLYYMQWHQLVDAHQLDDTDCIYGDSHTLDHPQWGPALANRPLIDAPLKVLSGDKLASWRETISHPLEDDYWAPLHFTDYELAALDIPIFMTDGWYDMTFGPIDYFTRLEKAQPGRDDRYLLIGPWHHGQTYVAGQPGEKQSGRVLPDNAAIDVLGQRLRFFDRYLKGDKSIQVQQDRVQVYITGSPNSPVNQWFYFSTFPVPNTRQKRLYLHSQGNAHSFPGDGLLDWTSPADEPVDHYCYDPAVPTAFITESYQDRRSHEIRADVLTYTSAPLTDALTIVGDICLHLFAASDALDTDWFAVITEVFPDGQSKSFHYAAPAFRARYRKGFDQEVLLEPNQPEQYTLPMGTAGHQIAAGHRLRLSIFSSAFPEYDPNTNTGDIVATDCQMKIARQSIYHDSQRPSYLSLPILSI